MVHIERYSDIFYIHRLIIGVQNFEFFLGGEVYGKPFYHLLGNVDILFIYKISYKVYKISNKKY